MTGTRTTWLGALAALVLACGSPPAPPALEDEAHAGDEVEESGHFGVLGAEQQAPDLPTRNFGAAAARSNTGVVLLRAAAAPEAPDLQTLYRQIAPGTVIVRTGASMGTGVVVGPGGLVLTNNHVIQGAARENFQLRATVEYGALRPSGAMVPDGERRVAMVLKTDPVHDLALLRVQEPPEEAPIVSLAADSPSPGAPVVCIGHGNVGLVWAVRSCEVEAIGRLEDTYARLQAVCASEEPMARRVCEQMREQVQREMAGLFVQSSCVIAPGDSGGPLVNAQGALVGLNVMSIRNERNQRSNFHIHLEELREFLLTVPDEPDTRIPSPWFEAVRDANPADLDLDGKWDLLVLSGPDRSLARLYDLDEDSPDFSASDLARVVSERRFDPEMAIVATGSESFVWYDADNDGRLETLLSVDRRDRVTAAHAQDQDGEIRPLPIEAGSPALVSTMVPETARERFSQIFEGGSLTENPSPLPAILRNGRVADSNRDGTPDTLRADQGTVHVLAFDADQNALSGVDTPAALELLLRSGSADLEASFLRRVNTMWGYYDLDGDGTFETGLRTTEDGPIVSAVIDVPGGPAATRASETLIGTLFMRGDWLAQGGEALGAMLSQHVPEGWIARPEDPAGLPHPTAHHIHPRIEVREMERFLRRWNNAIVSMESQGFSTVLIDVDRSSFRGPNRRRLADGIEAALDAGHFRANFALSTMSGAVWTWYDTDFDGTWDSCLVRASEGTGFLRNAFRRGEDDRWARDAEMVEGRLIRPALFGREQRQAFGLLARRLFDGTEVE